VKSLPLIIQVQGMHRNGPEKEIFTFSVSAPASGCATGGAIRYYPSPPAAAVLSELDAFCIAVFR
ncbi:MAG: hypothetical protein WAW18_04895, partial [Trichococcus flocculiformis]